MSDYVYTGPNLAADMEELERFRAERRRSMEFGERMKARAEQKKAERKNRRDAEPVVPFTMDAMVNAFERMLSVGFTVTPEYVQHLLQPYCRCEVEYGEGGWDLCMHARDLGFHH